MLPSEEEYGISMVGEITCRAGMKPTALLSDFEQGLRWTVLGCGIEFLCYREVVNASVITLDGCSRKTRWSSLLDCSPTYTTVTVAVP